MQPKAVAKVAKRFGSSAGLRTLAAILAAVPLVAQETRPAGPFPTAVYTLADHHTTRWTSERDPLAKIAGVCQIVPGPPLYTLACSAPPVSEPRTGRRHFYSVVLFRDLEENLYLAACASDARNDRCGDLKAGQTFSAEVEERVIRIVIGDVQLPLRILGMRPRPTSIDSPTRGTPSQVRFSAGAPSLVPYSKVSESRGTPSNVRPSEVSTAAAAPSLAPPSEVSTAAASPAGARLYVYCSAGAARVYVDNQLIGPAPIDVPLIPGRHTVRVQAPGFRVWVRTIEIPGGRTTKLTAELQR